MKEKELKELKLTKNIIIPFPNFQQNTIISPTQMNDNFEEIEHAYNTLIDNHNGAITKINKALSDITSTDNEAISNEQARIQAEETRVQNEEQRISDEDERRAEEKKRIAMYNTHLNDELRREQKHTEMVNTFNTKVEEVDTFVNTKKEEIESFVDTKTEEVEEFVDLKTNQVNNFITTKTTEVNAFVTAKGQEVQNAINAIPPKSELIGAKGDKGDKGEKGDKGDRGEQGLQGIQGIQGLQGVKGDKGDKGEQGIQGLKGDKGDKGDRGEQGVKGDTPSITHLETSINNKIQEVETRFNALTSSQQQDAEVIDARDGETSLKARLDRDIEKAKQVYVNVKGSHISTDSSSGYLKDVEILGNTIQDASNLADIRSIGDKVEGQELYEIPVLSCGKNLFDGELETGRYSNINGTPYDVINYVRGKNFIPVSPLLNLCINFKYKGVKRYSAHISEYDIEHKFIKDIYNSSGTYTLDATTRFIRVTLYCGSVGATVPISDVTDVQLECGTVATEYEPYIEDKLTILSPTPLEKVEDVADRIIEKGGVWGVEKNVTTVVLNGSEKWFKAPIDGHEITTRFTTAVDGSKNGQGISDLFKYKHNDDDDEHFKIGNDASKLFVYVNKSKLAEDSLFAFKSWLSSNNLTLKYLTNNPQFIPLPHDQQVKLRTFSNKTNISFLTEIEGTIKAQVPKSLGATVNTHTEQISNLNKELDRVKKLEESTVSTVETESDFTTVEATNGGYFEDVKLEGKTLVNLSSLSKINQSNSPTGYSEYRCLETQSIKSNTTYTLIFNSDLSDNKVLVQTYSITNNMELPISTGCTKGINVFKIVSTENTKGVRFRLLEGVSYPINITNIMLLEGDHTQNPPSYFEGLKSVGEGTDEIVVSSQNLNEDIKLSGRWLSGTTPNLSISSPDANNHYSIICNAIQGCKYRVKPIDRGYYAFLDKDYRVLIGGGVLVNSTEYETIEAPQNTAMAIFYIKSSNITEDITDRIVHVDSLYKQDKKQLLYYNEETQTWEKPILREWDSIEKHSDGKYYYHQRSGEVVLNGSENWSLHITNYFKLAKTDMKIFANDIKPNMISDRYVTMSLTNSSTVDSSISNGNGNPHIYIYNKSISTVEALKQSLQANNVTVVYQLAEEKVYECTNIDLITYANETNYVVECGAIAPKSTLKVHNNISNVVRTLQEKVSLLENKFIMGLKQVLAGDMYSLATLLYPEDFVSKEEPSDVPTLLI